MTSEDVMNAFKEKGIEVTLYETPYHAVENVVIDTYEHDKQIIAEVIEIIQSISENYATKLNAMDMYDEIMEQLKNHRF